ncbi:MAG: tRNA (adenosine(37)-N6)-dimethylallyltransferase MiaA [Desulfomonile tiedjei]|uniref:tRNA dimethylallyltransferase n=1 Tax=Desulfomonile tiedjei TaxID=2358 RepID=A0A9D6V3W8_9BACT|nr:tRNA (adenosine(37)-N6)-dimethylallyltransferase MiaA [Desulfomonile tiedjei]
MADRKDKIIIIAGPTASGKTEVSLRLAQAFDAEIVSADSVQIYRHMDVGSAKPTREERQSTPHHMVDIRDPDEDFSAGDYVQEARKTIGGIFERGRVPLVVGGTGLYIRLLVGGVAELPPAHPELRLKFREKERNTEGALYARLTEIDPETAERTAPRNVARIIRALEVFEITGKTISRVQKEHAFHDRQYEHLFVGLAPDRSILYERIDNRVDSMIKGGLLEEVVNLYELGYSRELKSMQSLGYRHAGRVLAGELDLKSATDLMKKDTRHYAKRQFTWFRSEPEVLWFDPKEIKGIGLMVNNFLGQ